MQSRFVCLFTYLELAYQLTTGVGDFLSHKGRNTQSSSIFTCVIPTDPTPGQLEPFLNSVRLQGTERSAIVNKFILCLLHTVEVTPSKGQSLALMVFTTLEEIDVNHRECKCKIQLG